MRRASTLSNRRGSALAANSPARCLTVTSFIGASPRAARNKVPDGPAPSTVRIRCSSLTRASPSLMRHRGHNPDTRLAPPSAVPHSGQRRRADMAVTAGFRLRDLVSQYSLLTTRDHRPLTTGTTRYSSLIARHSIVAQASRLRLVSLVGRRGRLPHSILLGNPEGSPYRPSLLATGDSVPTHCSLPAARSSSLLASGAGGSPAAWGPSSSATCRGP